MRPEIIRGKGFTHDSGYVSLFQIYVSDKTLFLERQELSPTVLTSILLWLPRFFLRYSRFPSTANLTTLFEYPKTKSWYCLRYIIWKNCIRHPRVVPNRLSSIINLLRNRFSAQVLHYRSGLPYLRGCFLISVVSMTLYLRPNNYKCLSLFYTAELRDKDGRITTLKT